MSEGKSRLGLAVPAVRGPMKARMLLSAPAGGGKTRSGLLAATILAEGGPIVLIDTEKESALCYAEDFTFRHIPWVAPFSPYDLAATIAEAGDQIAVVIVDSFTHFWKGDGGILDIADGKFGGWKVARPAQVDLIDAILGCKAHVILCAREKMAHAQEQNAKTGKIEVKKLGMEVQQDGDLEYEINVSLTLDKEHHLSVSKSRTTALPVGRTFQPGHVEDMAVLYLEWLKAGVPPAAPKLVEAFRARVAALPTAVRKACIQEFRAELGPPDALRESLVDQAESLVARFEAQARAEAPATGLGADGNGGHAGPESVAREASVPMAEGGAQRGAPAVEEPAGPVDAGPAADLAPIGPKAGKTLHTDVARLGVGSKVDQDRLALEASVGRTSHYGDLTAPEAADLLMRAEALVAGVMV